MAQLLVLVTPARPFDDATIAVLVEALDTDAYMFRLQLKRLPPLVLARNLDEDVAQRAAAILTSRGDEAYALDEDQMRNLRSPRILRTLQLFRDHLRFILPRDEMRLSPWDNLFLLVSGQCRLNVREHHERPTSASRDLHTFGATGRTSVSRQSLSLKLDIYFFDGSDPLRIDCDRFSFSFLGSKLGPSDTVSLQRTIAAIRKLAPHVILDERFEGFRRQAARFGGTRYTGSSDGSNERQVDDDAPRFDLYSRLSFLIHLERARRQADPQA